MSSVSNANSPFNSYMQGQSVPATGGGMPVQPSYPNAAQHDGFTIGNGGIALRAREVNPAAEMPHVPAPPGSQSTNGAPLMSVSEQLKRVDKLMTKMQSQGEQWAREESICLSKAKRMRNGKGENNVSIRYAKAENFIGNAAQANAFCAQSDDGVTRLTRFRNALQTLDGMVELDEIVRACNQNQVNPNLMQELEKSVQTLNGSMNVGMEAYAGLNAAQREKAQQFKERMMNELKLP